ncbi:MAG: Txe/YoeB family addiction module toxin [Snodgrassella sp.]|uniref:Txe/YoeB family addiction module toxin n=4 Tax=Neisseriaceae TaxID=481 RepID=UPI001EF61FD0|nr:MULTISPECIES: Txe/YoeB family addiction module toxin [Snodgrassella]MCO6516075.1 Txe/YoeB family addiction module toxin [Snodgrassella sp.]MCO6517437.1 Txe/YoeB family addiction module toxin [Snodgrassella sp.]MCO6523334.1 Txe/YoeB family addiction module toxin [Snodgrassella sp.]
MNFDFTPQSWLEYTYWQNQDRKTIKKINVLLNDIARNPYEGIGKPEALRENLSGFWSRRIDDKNRLVYRIIDDRCQIIQCKGHYSDK